MYLTSKEKKKILVWSIIGSILGLLLLATAFFVGLLVGNGGEFPSKQGKYTVYCTDDKNGKVTSLALSKEADNTIEPPVREGRVFLGYYDNGDVMYFDANGKQTVGLLVTNGLRVTAKWEFLEYTLTFDISSNPLFSMETKQETAHYGDTIETFPVPTVNDPAYAFAGWFNLDETVQYSDGTGKPVRAEYTAEHYPIENYETKFYAVLKKKICTLTLDYNDNGQTPSVVLELPYNEACPDLTAYKKDDGKKETVLWSLFRQVERELPATIKKDETFYAIWREYQEVGLSYAEDDLRTGRVYKEADGYARLPIPQKAGYLFDGWFLDNAFSGEKITLVNFDGLENTYYAKWKATDYTLSFQAGNGQEFEDVVYTYGSEKSLPNPVKEGYSFKGWICTDEGVEVEGLAPIYAITADLYGDYVLIAKWENSKYAVNLDANGGQTLTPQAIIAYETEYKLNVPNKIGYTFLGWFDGTDEGATQYTDGNGISKQNWKHAENGKTLYAKWRINTYTVRYETGSNASDVEPQTYEHGNVLVLAEKPVHADGKLFNGWYDESMKTEYTQKTIVEKDMVLYANWLDSKPISSVDDLLLVWENPSANYHLTKDIDLGGKQWACIQEFSGVFNGEGYKIYNFILSCTESTTVNFGFIGKNTGTIKNLIFEDVSLSLVHSGNCSAYAGIIAGYNTGSIIGCKAGNNTMAQCSATRNKDTAGSAYVGGLVGYSTGNVIACTSEVDFISCQVKAIGANYSWDAGEATMCLGGVVGYVGSGTASECIYEGEMTASNIYVTGYSSKVTCYMGGIVGWLGTNGTLKNGGGLVTLVGTGNIGSSHPSATTQTTAFGGVVGLNEGEVSACFVNGSVTGKTLQLGYLGGFVGWNKGEIVNGFSTATVTSCAWYQGGFVGYNAGSINGSYATGEVVGTTTGYCGGFVGNNVSGAVIMRSFSTGNVTNNSTDKNSTDVFVPNGVNNGTIQRCHYADSAVVTRNGTVVSVYEAVTGLSEKTTEELQSADFLYNILYWDNAVWKIVENGYPKLYWQN